MWESPSELLYIHYSEHFIFIEIILYCIFSQIQIWWESILSWYTMTLTIYPKCFIFIEIILYRNLSHIIHYLTFSFSFSFPFKFPYFFKALFQPGKLIFIETIFYWIFSTIIIFRWESPSKASTVFKISRIFNFII